MMLGRRADANAASSKSALPRILCIGAGGHASVIIDLLLTLEDQVRLVGVIDRKINGAVLGTPVVGTDADLARLAREVATHFIVGIGSVRGGAALRRTIFNEALATGLRPYTAVHPSAIVARSAVLGPGSAIMAGCVVQARACIGTNVIVNTRASIDHDCKIGDHAHVAPGAICLGAVRIGPRAHVGAGAVIIQGVRVGAGATVAAGATVMTNCAAHVTVFGTPAGPKKQRAPGVGP